MAATTTDTRIEFADQAAAVSVEMEKSMSETAATTKPGTRTRKAPAVEQPVADAPAATASEAPKAKAETKLFSATGRSGQVTARKAPAGTKFAVDVKRPGKPAYIEGVVTKFFSTEEAAQAFADAVNSGEVGKKNDWYADASDAVVVPAEAVA